MPKSKQSTSLISTPFVLGKTVDISAVSIYKRSIILLHTTPLISTVSGFAKGVVISGVFYVVKLYLVLDKSVDISGVCDCVSI